MGQKAAIERLAGAAIADIQPLSGGDIGLCHRVTLSDGRRLVVKSTRPGAQHTALAEARMLDHMARHGQPVPQVVAVEPGLLLIDHVPNDGRRDMGHVAETLARLHAVTAAKYGFDGPTVFAGQVQENPWSSDWPSFWANRRLKPMVDFARDHLPAATRRKLTHLADHIDEFLPAQPPASLLHGDLWWGNILFDQGKVVALIDPAIYYGHAEVDLAMLTLFGDPGREFFDRYRALRGLDDGFFQRRRGLYTLHPLLFHLGAFGPSYLRSVEAIIKDLKL